MTADIDCPFEGLFHIRMGIGCYRRLPSAWARQSCGLSKPRQLPWCRSSLPAQSCALILPCSQVCEVACISDLVTVPSIQIPTVPSIQSPTKCKLHARQATFC